MNHTELHNEMSEAFKRLKAGVLKPQLAKEVFNAAGKMINLAKLEFDAQKEGFEIDCNLLQISKKEASSVFKNKE